MSYLYLSFAIVCEVIATSALNASGGLAKLWPSVLAIGGYLLSFYALALALKGIPVGVAYAIWSGVGIVLITTVAWIVFGQKLDAPALAGMGLILAGVIVIQLLSKSTAH